jgi:flagellar basal body rod protein FlgB
MRVSAEYLNILQYRIDIVANNIANINTPALKKVAFYRRDL